jgi:hypothetical protein
MEIQMASESSGMYFSARIFKFLASIIKKFYILETINI